MPNAEQIEYARTIVREDFDLDDADLFDLLDTFTDELAVIEYEDAIEDAIR